MGDNMVEISEAVEEVIDNAAQSLYCTFGPLPRTAVWKDLPETTKGVWRWHVRRMLRDSARSI